MQRQARLGGQQIEEATDAAVSLQFALLRLGQVASLVLDGQFMHAVEVALRKVEDQQGPGRFGGFTPVETGQPR
jgi:hypothetical protein